MGAIEMGEGSRPRAEERGAQRAELPARDLGLGVLDDGEHALPVLLPFEVGAARELMREVVPRASGQPLAGNGRRALVQERLGVTILVFAHCRLGQRVNYSYPQIGEVSRIFQD